MISIRDCMICNYRCSINNLHATVTCICQHSSHGLRTAACIALSVQVVFVSCCELVAVPEDITAPKEEMTGKKAVSPFI